MEAGIIRITVQLPRGEDEKMAGGTGVEAALGGFPVFGDGLFLKEDEWQMERQGTFDYTQFTLGDAGCYEHRSFFGASE